MKIAFIGVGNMGRAIIGGLIKNKVAAAHEIIASDTAADYLRAFGADSGILTAKNNTEAVAGADAVVIAVKPQNLDQVLPELKGLLPSNAVLISVCAGAPIEKFRRQTCHKAIVRAMSNTPAQIGLGVSLWTAVDVTPAQKKLAQSILEAIGQAYYVTNEDDINKATALSGSGPAYFFLFIECLVQAGINLGFSTELARELALNTAVGSVLYAKQSADSLSVLREKVTSKGGTTAAALEVLNGDRLQAIIIEAVRAAYNRAVELGK
jgi:pyrroline-5-carboxylate reductase